MLAHPGSARSAAKAAVTKANRPGRRICKVLRASVGRAANPVPLVSGRPRRQTANDALPPPKKPWRPRISPRALTADDDRPRRFCADMPRYRPQHHVASDLPLLSGEVEEVEKWKSSRFSSVPLST